VNGVTFGSGDSDGFTFDPNTGRMTQYQFNVNGSSQIGKLGWNPNGTLHTLGITDPFNSADTQSCTYGYDDLGRVNNVGCPSVWAQTFTYDPFGNIQKTGNSAWLPNYNNNNQYSSISGLTPQYDLNGNLTADTFHTYTWNEYGKVAMIDTVGLTYDALGRMVEQNQSGTYYQVVYSPLGKKLAIMNGQTVKQAFVPLPGGTTAEYFSWGLSHYRHPDWLGSARLESGTTHAIIQDTAYAPFGEPYSELSGGNGEISFTGQNKDTDWLNYDFMYREYDPRQSRWISPDPAGVQAADFSNPQTWNRYAYVANNPLRFTDPDGMNYTVCDNQGKNCADLTDEQYDQWRNDNPNVQVSASGSISIVNDNGSTTKVGQESYYNEKDIQAAQQLVATQGLILNLGVRMYGGGITGGAFGWAAGEFIGGLAEGLSAEGEVAATAESGANTIVGSRRSPISVAPGTNEGTEIGGRWYTGHALDQMQGRGLMPSVIEDTIKTGTASPGNTAGTTVYATGQARVVVNSAGDVVTAMPK
jgi:RHS repeat-associated protein